MSVGNFIDIGIGVVILIAIVAGLARGFCKQFSRPLVVVISTIAAIFLVAIVYPLIIGTGILNGFIVKATSWFSGDFYTAPITNVEALRGIMTDNHLTFLSGSAHKIYNHMVLMLSKTSFDVTIGSYFGLIFVNIICEFGIWLVFYLVFRLLLHGIKYLLNKMTEVLVFKSIDKFFGLIWSLLCTYFIVVGIILTLSEIVITQFFPGIEATVANWISDSILLNFAHSTNALGSFIANLLGVNLITL